MGEAQIVTTSLEIDEDSGDERQEVITSHMKNISLEEAIVIVKRTAEDGVHVQQIHFTYYQSDKKGINA